MAQRKGANEAPPIMFRLPRVIAAELYVLLCYNAKDWNKGMRADLEQRLSRQEIGAAHVNDPGAVDGGS